MIWLKTKIDNIGFKLGTERGNFAIGGEIRKKMSFHKESGDPDLSVPGTPVIRKKLEKDVLGEAKKIRLDRDLETQKQNNNKVLDI